MMDNNFQQEAQPAADKIKNTEKRERTVEHDPETVRDNDVVEVRHGKRAKLDGDTGAELPSCDSQSRRRPANKRLLSLNEGKKTGKTLETDGITTSKDGGGSVDSPLEDLENRSIGSHANIRQLYGTGVSEMFLLNKVETEPPVMLMKVSYVLAQEIEKQVSNGLAYRRAKDASLLEIDRALRNNKILGDCVLERMRDMLKLKGDRKPTPEENEVVQRMRQEVYTLDKTKETFEAEKARLMRDIELTREAWERAVSPVEDIFQDVFVQCGILDEPTPGKGQRDMEGAHEGKMENNRAYIKLEERKARRKLREAQKQHEQHRDTFRRRLAAYIAGVVDRPGASKRLLEEEFSRDHVRTCYELAGLVKRAEAAHEAQLAAAAEAHVSIIGSDDDMSPNIPYDLKEYAEVKIANLDHEAVEAWNKGVDDNAQPNLKPAGYVLHMAEKWKRALEADGDVSSSEDESVWDGGIEACRDASTVHNSMAQPVTRKSKKADQYLSVSERAEGGKLRRIEDWTQKTRPIES